MSAALPSAAGAFSGQRHSESETFAHYRLNITTRVMYAQNRGSVLGSLATCCLMISYAWGYAPPSQLLAFGASWVTWCTLIIYLTLRYNRVCAQQTTAQFQCWAWLHRMRHFGNCSIFSSGAYLLSTSTAPDSVWVATLAGTFFTCAVVLNTSWDFASFMCAVPVVLLTLFGIQLSHGAPFIAAATVLFMVYSIFGVRELQRGYDNSIAQGFENLDLAQKLAIEKALAESGQRQAEEANAAKSRFFAAANHDLRQPLHALTLGVDLLHSHLSVPDLQGTLRNTHMAVQALNKLFNQLMEVSRLDSGTVVARSDSFALQPLLSELQAEFAPLAAERQIRLVLRPTVAWVLGDRLMLERVLRNLLGNAIRYTEAGSVVLACRPWRGQLRLQVWDTGIGMDAADIPHIFEEFRQINPQEHLRGQAQGLGLGLSIVQRMCNAMGCAIRVRSQPGKGSLFEVCVAQAPARAQHATAPALAKAPPAPHTLTGQVVVLEDDEQGRQAMVDLLTTWGAQVTAYAHPDALQADWARLGVGAPRFILDYQIGSGNSAALIAYLLATAPPDEPPDILVVSGLPDPDLEQQLATQGVGFLRKPVAPEAMHAWLSAAAQRRTVRVPQALAH